MKEKLLSWILTGLSLGMFLGLAGSLWIAETIDACNHFLDIQPGLIGKIAGLGSLWGAIIGGVFSFIAYAQIIYLPNHLNKLKG